MKPEISDFKRALMRASHEGYRDSDSGSLSSNSDRLLRHTSEKCGPESIFAALKDGETCLRMLNKVCYLSLLHISGNVRHNAASDE